MLAACIILGSLCVPAQYVPVTRVSIGPVMSATPLDKFDEAESRRRGLEILSWSSDSIQLASPLGLSRVCAAGSCVYYLKHCEGTSCKYLFSQAVHDSEPTQDGLWFSRGLDIHTRSTAQLRHVIGALRLAVDSESGTSVSVPLARLSTESSDLNHMRSCMRSIWVQGCPRPELPQLRSREHP